MKKQLYNLLYAFLLLPTFSVHAQFCEIDPYSLDIYPDFVSGYINGSYGNTGWSNYQGSCWLSEEEDVFIVPFIADGSSVQFEFYNECDFFPVVVAEGLISYECFEIYNEEWCNCDIQNGWGISPVLTLSEGIPYFLIFSGYQNSECSFDISISGGHFLDIPYMNESEIPSNLQLCDINFDQLTFSSDGSTASGYFDGIEGNSVSSDDFNFCGDEPELDIYFVPFIADDASVYISTSINECGFIPSVVYEGNYDGECFNASQIVSSSCGNNYLSLTSLIPNEVYFMVFTGFKDMECGFCFSIYGGHFINHLQLFDAPGQYYRSLVDTSAHIDMNCTNEDKFNLGWKLPSLEEHPHLNYKWYDTAQNFIFEGRNLIVSDTGIYYLEIIDIPFGVNEMIMVTVLQSNSDSETLHNITFTSGVDTVSCRKRVSVVADYGESFESRQYLWTDANGQLIETEKVISIDAGGIYYCTAREMGKCPKTIEFEVYQNFETLAAIAGDDIYSLCDEVQIPSPDYFSEEEGHSYWLPLQGNIIGNNMGDSIIVIVPGIYQLVVDNHSTGCYSYDTLQLFLENVEIEEMITQTINCQSSETCNTFDLPSDANNYTWEWETLETENTVTLDNMTVTVCGAGTYNYTYRDENTHCEESGTVSLNIIDDIQTPDFVLSIEEQDCSNIGTLAAQVDNSSNLSFEWTNTTGEVLGNSQTLEVDSPGSYTLLVQNTQNYCSSIESIVVPDLTINISPTVDGILSCNNQEVALQATDAPADEIMYTWVHIESGTTFIGHSFTSTLPGTYELQANNQSTSCIVTGLIDVEMDISTPQIALSNTISCENALLSAEIISSIEEYTILWQDETGNNFAEEELILSVENTGNYSFQITDLSNGCSTFADISIDIPTMPQIELSAIIDCGFTILQGSVLSNHENLSYSWTNENEDVVSTESALEANQNGLYTLSVVDESGICPTISEINVTIAEPLSTEILEVIHDSGSGTGEATIFVEGGIEPYQFSWYLGENVVSYEQNPTDLISGDYVLEVMDALNCISLLDVNVQYVTATSTIAATEITLYPNPAHDVIFIDGIEKEKIAYSIYDSRGRFVQQNIAQTTINVHDFPKGLYWIIISLNGQSIVEKIIVH